MKLTQIERQTLVKVGSALEGAMYKVSEYGKYFFDEVNFGLKLSYEEMAAFKRAITKINGQDFEQRSGKNCMHFSHMKGFTDACKLLPADITPPCPCRDWRKAKFTL